MTDEEATPGAVPAPPTATRRGVLDGVRVLDLSRWVAGEYATKLFADFGADVVKVEKPVEGSHTRRWGPFPGDEPDPERSALFLHLNTNKRSIALDFTLQDDRETLLRLVESADAVVESFRPGTLERHGIGPREMHERNPRLVITRISAFGQTGPYAGREATGLVLQAMGGPMNATGGPGRPPHRKPGNLEHYTVGRSAGSATMAGLFAARRTGRGSVIDVSGQEVLLSGADRRASYLMSHAFSGWIPPRGVRSVHRSGTTFTGPFPAADGYVMLYVTTKDFWNRLVRMIGAHDQEFQDKYLDRQTLGDDWDDFDDRVRRWFASRPKNQIMEEGEAARIPLTALLEVPEVLAHPHFRDRGAFVRAEHPVAGSYEYTGAPWRMDGGFELLRTAPLLGGDEAEIRRGLVHAVSASEAGPRGDDGNADGTGEGAHR